MRFASVACASSVVLLLSACSSGGGGGSAASTSTPSATTAAATSSSTTSQANPVPTDLKINATVKGEPMPSGVHPATTSSSPSGTATFVTSISAAPPFDDNSGSIQTKSRMTANYCVQNQFLTLFVNNQDATCFLFAGTTDAGVGGDGDTVDQVTVSSGNNAGVIYATDGKMYSFKQFTNFLLPKGVGAWVVHIN